MSIASKFRNSALAFPVTAIAGLILVLISEASYWRTRTALDSMSDYYGQSLRIQYVLRLVVDAETSQRGYLLTRHPEYLQPYRQALEKLPARIADLHAYARTRGSEVEAESQRLGEAIDDKLAEIGETLRLDASGHHDEALRLVDSDAGRRSMDRVRDLAQNMRDEESTLVAGSRNEVYKSLLANRLGIGMMTGLCLLALRMYLQQSRALLAQEMKQNALLQEERDGMEVAVAQRTEELAELSGHLQTAREDERSRLARELHDELGALLTAAKLHSARIRKRVAGYSQEVIERLAQLDEALNAGIALKRRIIEDLTPSSLRNLGLVNALQNLTEDFEKRTEIKVAGELEEVALKASSQLTVYRLVQEALTNVSKYSQARNVKVALSSTAGAVSVSVDDDGVGFDPSVKKSSVHGLVGMRYRVASEGGVFVVRSAPGRGTSLQATWPLAKPAQPA